MELKTLLISGRSDIRSQGSSPRKSRRKDRMIFTQLNPGSCRTYLIADEKSREAVLVDPVLEHVQDYIKTIEQQKLTLTHVIDTHTHADHISGGASLKDQV